MNLNSQRIVGVHLEDMLTQNPSGDGGVDLARAEMAAGVDQALRTIRRLGGTCLALTHHEESQAHALVERAGIEVEVRPGLDRMQQAALLSRIGAWAYIGSDKDAIGVMHTQRVHTIGIAPDGISRERLWEAGADAIVPAAASLPRLLHFPPRSTDEFLTAKDVVAALDITNQVLSNWKGQGYMPELTDLRNARRVPRQFVHLLLEHLRGTPPTTDQVRLVKLLWQLRKLGSAEEYREARLRLQQGRVEGALLSPAEAARLLGRHPATVQRWSKQGSLHPISIPPAGRLVYSSMEVREAKKQDEQLTTYEAAAELGVSTFQVIRFAEKGALPAAKLPLDYRFNPGEVTVLNASRQHDYLSQTAVARALQIKKGAVHLLVASGRLTFVEGKGYNPAEVKALQEEQQRLNPAFEGWFVFQPKEAAYTTKQVAHRLGTTRVYISQLSQLDLLPFRSPSLFQKEGSRTVRFFPVSYINMLVAYVASDTSNRTLKEKMIAFREQQKERALAKTTPTADDNL